MLSFQSCMRTGTDFVVVVHIGGSGSENSSHTYLGIFRADAAVLDAITAAAICDIRDLRCAQAGRR
jgi:hypothetical protein